MTLIKIYFTRTDFLLVFFYSYEVEWDGRPLAAVFPTSTNAGRVYCYCLYEKRESFVYALFSSFPHMFHPRSMYVLIIYLVLFASTVQYPSTHDEDDIAIRIRVYISSFSSFHAENVCLLVGHDLVCHIEVIPPGTPYISSIKFPHRKFHYRFPVLLNQMRFLLFALQNGLLRKIAKRPDQTRDLHGPR